jgi:hypothetical protein
LINSQQQQQQLQRTAPTATGYCYTGKVRNYVLRIQLGAPTQIEVYTNPTKTKIKNQKKKRRPKQLKQTKN